MVLVDWGDDLTGEVSLDGRQLVQNAEFVRSAGSANYARGNESHRLDIPRSFERESIAQAHDALFLVAQQVPRTGDADCLVEVQGGGSYMLRSSAIESWGGAVDGHLSDHSFSVVFSTIETLHSSPVTVGAERLEPSAIDVCAMT